MASEQYPNESSPAQSFRTVVIGGGQAGLAAGYCLAQKGEDFIILDKNPRSGDAWRQHWDSLRLFTPSQYNSLPGMPYAGEHNYYPTKDEVADYLENYAAHFKLPVQHNANVEKLSRNGTGYKVMADGKLYSARNVIVATGAYQKPYTPQLSSQLDPSVFQLHSSAYRNARQVPAQSVLVVGAANSGAEIAMELAKAGKQVWLAGRDVGRIPSNTPLGKVFDGRLAWWMVTRLMTLDTPIGRKVQTVSDHHGTPLGRLTREAVTAAGVSLAPRLSGVQGGQPQLEDGQVLPVDGVLWATGFKPDYSWADLPITDLHGYPVHRRGVAAGAPGLYYVGLFFQSGLSSSFLGGVGKDAAFIADLVSRYNN